MKNLRYFFINYICHSTVTAIANTFVAVLQMGIAGYKGMVCAVKHGNIVIIIANAYQDLSTHLLLQLPGGIALADALGVNVQNTGSGTEYNDLISVVFLDPCLSLVHFFHFPGFAGIEAAHGVVVNTAKQSDL